MNRWAAFLAGVFIAIGAAPALAASPEPFAVEGWTISHAGSPMACVAAGPSDGSANLSLTAEGPQFEMIVVAPDFPRDKGAYQATLAFDDQAPVQAAALGENGMLAISVGRGESARTVAAASRVSVMVAGHAHAFSLTNAAAALDALARCAGQPTLSEQDDQPPKPIAGAGAWQLMPTMPGVPGRACAARVAGDQIDTIMLLNKDGDLVLVGGHNGWATWGGDMPLGLSIDGAAPLAVKATTLNNLIMALVTDPAELSRLRSAKTLDWTLPTGIVRGRIAGFGLALDAMKACKAQ